MSQAMDMQTPGAKGGQGFLRRLFGRTEKEVPGSAGSPFDLGDIQGFVLRGYRMPMVRHFLLTVDDPAGARRLLGRLVSGDESDAPQIRTSEDWHVAFEPGLVENP